MLCSHNPAAHADIACMSSEDPIETREQQRGDTAKLARQVAANDIKWLMSVKQGRRLMHRLIGEAGVYRTTFTGNSETFFREGKRAFGLFLMSEVKTHSPEEYLLMLAETKAKTE